MKKTLTSRSCLVVLGGALLICGASNINADTYFNGSEYYPGSIDLGQATAGVTGSQTLINNDCAPVATANGLSYLYGLAPGAFSTSPDNSTAINALTTDMLTSDAATHAGTTAANAQSGLTSYVGPTGANDPGVTVSPQVSNPTAQTLANALNAKEAVQLGILWGATPVDSFIPGYYGYTGGHFVSLTAINYDATTGTGTVTILDPWGNNPGPTPDNAEATASTVTLYLYGQETLNNPSGPQILEVGWPGEPTYSAYGPDDTTQDNQTGATSFGSYKFADGYIALADIESIPEPTTMSLLLAPFAAGMLRMLRKNRGA
jgi:hypothetical protein